MKTARHAYAPGEDVVRLTDPEPSSVYNHPAVDPHKTCDETVRGRDLGRLPEKNSLPLQLCRVSLRMGNPRPNVLQKEIVRETAHLLGMKAEGKSRCGPARLLAKKPFELTFPLSALFRRKQVGE